MNQYFYLLFGLVLASPILSTGILLGVVIGSFGTLGYLRWRFQRGLPNGMVVRVVLPHRLAYAASRSPEQDPACLPPPPPLLQGPEEDGY